MKRIIKWFAMSVASVMLAIGQAGAATPGTAQTAPANKPTTDDLFPGVVVAKGKGIEIKRSQLDDAMVSIKSTFVARGQDISPDDMNKIEQQVLDRLIQIQCLLHRATDADKAAGKETCTKRLDAIKARAGNEETLNRQLKSVGTSPEELQAKMLEESTAQVVMERELKVNVSDSDVQKFYDDNPSKFEQPEMVRASHILLSIRDPETNKDLSAEQKAAKHKKAEEVLTKAKAGEDFAKLAKEYSEDPGSKDKGGEYQFARGQMVSAFETAAFGLKTNQVSDIVTTEFGYHIIKLNEKIAPKKVELAKVAPDIKEYLKQEQLKKRQQDLQEYFQKLKKDFNIEVLDDSLKIKETASAEPPAIIPPAGRSAASDGK